MLERDLNSHLWVSRPPLYPLSYQVNGDWWRVLSNVSGRKKLEGASSSPARANEFFVGGSSVRINENKLVLQLNKYKKNKYTLSIIACRKLILKNFYSPQLRRSK